MAAIIKKVGLGGGCHWCTEAVFASLKGVTNVEQGWISSQSPDDMFSEAVVVTYHSDTITLKELIEIHLHTHSSTSRHSMREKYRSAVYCFTTEDKGKARLHIEELQTDFIQPIITQVLPFIGFKASLPQHLNYYYSNPDKLFCTLYINPKIQMIKQKFARLTDKEKVS